MSDMTTDWTQPADSMNREEPDPWFPHFLRYLGVSFSVGIAICVIVGLFWWAGIFSRTGYRKRDLLLMVVPIVGTIVAVKVMWRYTARSVYWTPRDDRSSTILTPPLRPWAIGAGYVLYPVLTLGAIAVIASVDTGWSDAEKTDLRDAFIAEGVSEAQADCIVDRLADEHPNGPPEDEERAREEVVEAAESCR